MSLLKENKCDLVMPKYEVKTLFFVSLLPALSRSRLPACSRALHTPSDALRAPVLQE